MHACPETARILEAESFAATAKSASSKTMSGDLPPSSSVTVFKLLSAAAFLTALPVAVDPVKANLRMSICFAIASPQGRPNPLRIFSTPGGKPISFMTRATARHESGLFSELLSTMVFPAVSAGPIFMDSMRNGVFHGMMAPVTPYGWRTVMPNRFGSFSDVSPWMSMALLA